MSSAWQGRTLGDMTITIDTQTTTDHATNGIATTDRVELSGGLFFQPSPVTQQALRLAADGVDVVVSMPLAVLSNAPLTGVTRRLVEASLENRLRQALRNAGFTTVRRRGDVTDTIVLDASPAK
jgi:hypothetical protein